ncbi:MAG: outer membrane protein transport protein [Planctomycetes bacterium]|nr:outer membrane protein transport protein [Planctomycetota bacterium]
MPQRSFLACFVVAFLALAGVALAANGPLLSTIGSKGPVDLPVDGDGWSMFRMPSSIGWNVDTEIDLDMFLFTSKTQLRNAVPGTDTGNNLSKEGATFGANGGVVVPLGRLNEDSSDEEWDTYSDAGKITFGFGIFVDMAGGTGGSTKVRYTTYPETIPQRAGIQFVAPTLVVAFTPTEWLSLGVGLHAIYGKVEIRSVVGGGSTPLNGSPQLNGTDFPGSPSYADFLSLFSNDNASDPTTYFKADLTAIQFSATLSASFRIGNRVGIGLSYRPRSWAPENLSGDGLVDSGRTFQQALGGLAPGLQSIFLSTLPNGGANGFAADYDIEMRSIYVPRQIRMSVVVWPVDRVVIGAEIAWIEWHRAFRRFNLSLKSGNNEDVNFVVGSNRIDTTLDQRWRNRWAFSLYTAIAVYQRDLEEIPTGVVVDNLTLRFGINYSDIAVNEDVSNNSPNAAFVTTNLNVGASLQMGMFTIHSMVEHGFYGSARSNDRPQSLTGKNTFYSATQWFYHFGLTVRF